MTVIIALMFNASAGVSITIPKIILGDYDVRLDGPDYTKGRERVEYLVYFLAFMIALLTIPPILFFNSHPKSPPSYTASDVNFFLEYKLCIRENYSKAGKTLLSNKDYLLLALAFPFILGNYEYLKNRICFIIDCLDGIHC